MKAIDMTGEDYYCQASDVNLIKKIVKSLPDSPVCINIGTAFGTSALAMLEARPDSIVVSIDIEECPEANKIIDDFGYIENRRYFFNKGRSQDIARGWKYPAVNFVFIDGGHTYQECYEDALLWYRLLHYDGIMAFHDYESKIQILESVKRAVDDVVKVLDLKFVEREGTMMVFKKTPYDKYYNEALKIWGDE